MLKGWLQEATREEHLNALHWLLTPLEPEWGEVVKATLTMAQGGAQISKAGETLSAGLRAWKQEQGAHSAQIADENEQLRRERAHLEQENKRLQDAFKQLEISVAALEEKIAEQEQTLCIYKNTIVAQNDVLAEQHYKLANIFGNSTNSTSA